MLAEAYTPAEDPLANLDKPEVATVQCLRPATATTTIS